MAKVYWGILGTAKIGTEKVIPALQKSPLVNVTAIASRTADRAADTAAELGIARAHSSYEALLADDDIHAIYNPLPNHLHVPWTKKAIEAGKHVLCEKPIALDVSQATELRDFAAQYPQVKVMEAFMYRFHPQWQTAREWLDCGKIGQLRTIQTFFSYFNNDPDNIRNKAEIGGGGLMDIGCYPISQARYMCQAEPSRVMALLDIDPKFSTDRDSTGILDFNGTTATFTCSTQMSPYQRTHIVGTSGRIEIEIPVNSPSDQTTRAWLTEGEQVTEKVFDVCDQYTLQAEAFCRAILNNESVPTSLDDAVANMRVIAACVQSHATADWVAIAPAQ